MYFYKAGEDPGQVQVDGSMFAELAGGQHIICRYFRCNELQTCQVNAVRDCGKFRSAILSLKRSGHKIVAEGLALRCSCGGENGGHNSPCSNRLLFTPVLLS